MHSLKLDWLLLLARLLCTTAQLLLLLLHCTMRFAALTTLLQFLAAGQNRLALALHGREPPLLCRLRTCQRRLLRMR